MAVKPAPRSVSDATRFTASTPQPASKAPSAAAGTGSRFSPSSGSVAGGRRPSPPPPPPAGGGRGSAVETPDQRVARLRAAHLAAKQAKVSWFDRWVVSSRSFFDATHKYAVVGLIGFTAITALLTAYTAADMYMFNRKRKAEFREKMRQVEADSLEAARVAYMTNKATEEQIALVEEANARATAAGPGGLKLPSLLGPPSKIHTDGSSSPAPSSSPAGVAVAATNSDAPSAAPTPSAAPVTQSSSWRSWFGSSLTKSEEGESIGTSQRGLGEDDGAGVRNSDILRAIDEKRAAVQQKARTALEHERENQRSGGPLDRTGLAMATASSSGSEQSKRTGWLWR